MSVKDVRYSTVQQQNDVIHYTASLISDRKLFMTHWSSSSITNVSRNIQGSYLR